MFKQLEVKLGSLANGLVIVNVAPGVNPVNENPNAWYLSRVSEGGADSDIRDSWSAGNHKRELVRVGKLL